MFIMIMWKQTIEIDPSLTKISIKIFHGYQFTNKMIVGQVLITLGRVKNVSFIHYLGAKWVLKEAKFFMEVNFLCLVHCF